jgi:PhnB protein
MATVSTYLNFMGRTEEAFEFYRSVFGTEYSGDLMRMGDVPPQPDMPELSDADKRAVMHVALPILGGHLLMGTDMLESMGHALAEGNNVSIMLQPDSKADADDLFAKLSAGGTEVMPMDDMFWGDYFGSFCDRFGIRWMIDVSGQPGG